MSGFSFSAMAARNTQVESKCPGCGGRVAPGKWGPWCPAKCGYRFPKGSGFQKTKRPADYAPLATPSSEQVDIFRAAKNAVDQDHLMIEALAGTGKTTVLTDMAYWYSERGLKVLCLAFTKRDRTALEAKIPESVAKVWTSNGAGLAILSNYASSCGVKFDLSKNLKQPFDLLKTRLEQDGLIAPTGEWQKGTRQILSAVLGLVGKARTTLPLSATGRDGMKTHPTDQDWNDLALRFGIECKDQTQWPFVLQYASALFRQLADLKTMLSRGGCDHDNCVFLPAYHNLIPSFRYGRVLVDEAQDQSYANRTIAELYREPSRGRIVAVGDSRQAIYAWRGADQFALDEMSKLMSVSGSIRRFPLTLCRRCSQSVIVEAQKLVPAIQPLPNAPDGLVRTVGEEDFRKELKSKRKGLVLCRANAPMVSLCLELLKESIPAVLVRSNVVGELQTLVKNACEEENYSGTPATEVIKSVEAWRGDKVSKLAERQGTESQVQLIEDKAACVYALAEGDKVRTAQDILDRIDRMFPEGYTPDPEKMVTLSTVHGAKGSEADTVYLYSPPKESGSLWDAVWSDAVDRDNVLYVGITRAKRELVYAGAPPTVSPMATEDQRTPKDVPPVRPVGMSESDVDGAGTQGLRLPKKTPTKKVVKKTKTKKGQR